MADSSHSTLFAGLEMGDIKVKNSRGSSAGAGSGDCHHYLQGRRAEMFRMERLKDQSEQSKLDAAWQEEMDKRVAESESEKAKRAAKRNKKKLKRKAAQDELQDAKKPKLEEATGNEIHKVAPIETPNETEETPITAKVKETVGITLKDD